MEEVLPGAPGNYRRKHKPLAEPKTCVLNCPIKQRKLSASAEDTSPESVQKTRTELSVGVRPACPCRGCFTMEDVIEYPELEETHQGPTFAGVFRRNPNLENLLSLQRSDFHMGYHPAFCGFVSVLFFQTEKQMSLAACQPPKPLPLTEKSCHREQCRDVGSLSGSGCVSESCFYNLWPFTNVILLTDASPYFPQDGSARP